MDKLLLLIPTLSYTIFDFYRVMRPQGRITRFLFYFAEAGRPASWFAGQTMKKLTDMAEYSGRGRVTPFAVILAKRGSPKEGQGSMTPWTRRLKASVIQRGAPAPRGIPRSGAGRYVVVTLVEPTGGFPRGARE